MRKEWILNTATNRWGLNRKSIVGPVSSWIRDVQPKDVLEWQREYFKKLKDFLNQKKKTAKNFAMIEIDPQTYLEELGHKLFVKVTEVLAKEVEEITLEDCVTYIRNLVINRTFDGFLREKQTVYSMLEKQLDVKLIPAPDEMDRRFNVDFYIPIQNQKKEELYIGIQIKPLTFESFPQDYNWKKWISEGHEKFREKYGGNVFIVFSDGAKNRKEIFK